MKKNREFIKRLISLFMALMMTFTCLPLEVFAEEIGEGDVQTEEQTVDMVDFPDWSNIDTTALHNTIPVSTGQLLPDCQVVDNDIYGYVVNYPLKKGHILSISDTNYVFSVRKLVDGNYSTMLKQATADKFTATEDMTVGMLIRKPDKSTLTAEELASIAIYDSQYGMIGVEGYAHRFTVEADTIEGGTKTTRCNLFLPVSYSETGTATRLIVMTNGHSAHLTESVWNKNTADNVGIIRNYLNAGYAVYVVDNTDERTSQTPDLGCPQLVSSYRKAYEYIQQHFNVEKKLSIHSRSFGTFAAIRLMQEIPELIKCAVMTGPRVSIAKEWAGLDKAHIANRFGFADTTGATYEADKMVGYDPYKDIDRENYVLPPTYWAMSKGDATDYPTTFINKLIEHGNDVTYVTHTGTDHTGVCTLNTEEMFSAALVFLNEHQSEASHTHTYTSTVTAPTCTEQGFTTHACECGDSYMDSYAEAKGHSYKGGKCTACGETAPSLKGKTISILGASISTFAGTSNGVAADTTNSTIRNNAKYYPHNVVTDVELTDTWWMQVANDLGLRLLVNNSWSGSSLLHERNGTVGAYVDRCVQLHDDTGDNAGEMPDIIGIQMGTNDFQYYKDTLGTANINYAALISENEDGNYTYATPVTSLEAAAIVLHKISVRYPDAEVYYLNISQRVDDTDELIQSFNGELKKVVEHFGAHIVDIYGSAITMADFDTYIGDGKVHPNKLGMDAYAEAFKKTLVNNTAYTVDTHTVSLNLDDVTADYGDDKIVVDGSSYTVKLSTTAKMDLDVTVTMGGKDVTASAYANGTVTLDSVTDDVTITAKAVYEPKEYRWTFNGTDLACVRGSNALTKLSGSTTDGVFSKTSYALADEVVLLHNLPWVVEWKCEGTFLNTGGSSGARVFTSDNVNANYDARYIFKSNTNGLVAMGEKTTSGSHNYGIALADYDIDWTKLHTYRLENRIANDGGNMVWLSVDGVEIGALDNYYVGTTNKNTTSNWLSGKDFVFPYMGTDTHGFTNASIDHITVWEGGHAHNYKATVTAPTCTEQGFTTHACECSDSYVDSYVDAKGHSYKGGKCTVCGETIPQPEWEQGTILAATGLEKDTEKVIRTSDYLRISDYVGMTLNAGHYITYFVYDAQYNYLGNGSSDLTANFLLNGQGISTHEMQIRYPEGVYFRIALWRGNNNTMTLEMLDEAGVECLDATHEPVFWEMGSIYAASGLAFVRGQVIRSVNYLPIESYAGVTVADGYAISFLAYDENLTYLGNGNPEKKGYFIPARVTMQEITDQYPTAKYVRLLLVEQPLADFSMDAVELSDIRIYKVGEIVPEKTYSYQGFEASFEIEFVYGLLDVNNGTYHSTDSGFVTARAIPLKHVSKITWAEDHSLLWSAYNAQNEYLGSATTYSDSGEVTKADILAVYDEANYVAVSVKPTVQRDLELTEMVKESGLTIHHDLSHTGSIAHNTVMQAQKSQDGAIYDNTLFLFDKYGQCTVYDTSDKLKLGSFTLDKIDLLNPHANSVCFSDVFYEEGDSFPLLYVNIYNNYWTTDDPKEGTCCVYRIFEENGTYSTKLIQVLKIGFTDDYDLWNSAEGNGYHYYLPYGNFVVDTDENKLWAFVLRNGDNQTRFFRFDLPEIGDGIYNESYGCNVVTLEASDIEDLFDLEHFEILQGCTYANGKIYSANGLGTSSSYNAFAELKVVNLRSKSVAAIVDFSILGFSLEPEMISFNVGGDGQLYYLSIDGVLRKLRFADSPLNAPLVESSNHTYTSGICTVCGAEDPDYVPTFLYLNEAVAYLREQMKARIGTVTLRIADMELTAEQGNTMLSDAIAHTGVPTEGDYFRRNMGFKSCSVTTGEDANGVYSDVTFKFDWYTTAEMEAEVDAAMETLLNELNLWNASDYEKIVGVYDWIGENIEYDHDRYDEEGSTIEHTTYAAIVDRLAVCQGYASLYYRLLLELGVDCRVISGLAGLNGGESHAWNIVKLEGKYYNADPTWDADLKGHYRYFLCTMENFKEHVRDDEFDSESFHTQYPMSLVPYVVNATASGSVNGAIEWVLDGETGTLTVAGTGAIPSYRYASAPWYPYRESVKSIVVSEGITEVGERAFYWCTNCTSVTLPESLVAIREYGFNNLRALQEIKLPSKLTTIEFCAFSECVGLQSIVIPNSVTSIGSSAFSNCYALTSATLSAGMTTIPDSMFFGDRNLKKVVLQNGLTTIGDTAFADCGITSFTIPATVTSIGVSAFAGCRSNNSFTVKAGNTAYKAVNGVLFTYDGKTLISYPAGKFGNSYAVPEGTVTIDHSAFSDAYMLKTITFASSVRTIMHSAFAHCDVLASITFPSGITSIGDSALRECNKLTSVTFENPDVVLGPSVFSDCDGLVSIQLPTRLKELSYGMFSGCAKLKNVTIPSTVTKMGSTVFADCDSLVSITVPGSVKSLGQQAFDFCNNLETIIFKEGVESLGWICIRNAPSLKKVVLPSSITTIEKENFDECPNVVVYVNCGSVAHHYAQSNDVATSVTHNYKTTVTAPTCTAQGYTTHTCTACGSSYKDTYVSALGHSYGGWEIVKESTCTEQGSERRDCTRCDAYETQVIEVTEHPYEAVVTAPTCTEQGYTTHTCSVCGDSYVDSYVAEKGHSFKNGVCGNCGISKKPYQRLTYFTVDVESETGKIYADDAVLYLPANYSPNGEPVKLIIYCKQGSSKITGSSNPIESVGFYNYLINLGYAVLGVDGVPDAWRDELGLDDTRVVGNPLAVQATENAYEYVIENYNIAADGCFISGYSQGGHYAQNVIDLTSIPILAAAEQSPVCSMRYHQWDLSATVTVNSVKFTKAARLNVARIYGFPAVSTNTDLLNLSYDASLVAQYDPWLRNTQNVYTGFVQQSNLWYLPEGTSLDSITMSKTSKCPVKIWCAEDDTAISTDVMKVFVKAIQNAGGTAEISIAPSGGHGFFQKQSAVGNFVENGKTYNTLPVAVEIAEWFEQYGGYACQHDFASGWMVATAPTCTEKGMERRACVKCGYSETRAVFAKGHTEVIDEAVPPTCTETGLTEGKHCSVCDAVLVKQEVVAANGHDYETVVTAPTCTERGYTTHTCTVCDDSYVDSYVSAKGHSYGAWTVTTAPTCTEQGVERRDCKNCDHFETRDVAAKGHSYKSVVTAPTCTERGYTTHTCTACGDSYVDSYVNTKGHSYGAWAVITASTCTEKGVEHRDCQDCDHFETREVAAKGHTEVIDEAVAPTCTETGLTEGKHCSVCDAVLVKQEAVAANGHDYEIVVTAPTCTERGYTTHTCSVCDDSYVDSYVNAKGHSYGAWTVTTAPTCTEKGTERRDCKNCDHFETREIAAKGHTEVIDKAVAPTCTETGLTEGKHCSVCTVIIVAPELLPALGHEYDKWYISLDATCTAEGEEKRECERCDVFETKVIAALGHTEVIDAAVAPTCIASGLTEGKHCTVCEAVITPQEIVQPLGHTFGAFAPVAIDPELGHYQQCLVCDYVSVVIPHADMDGNTWCDDCNYSMILRIQYFALSHEYILLTAGESAELLPIIEPAGMVNRIVWSSSDESVFTIDENGVISAKAEGTAYAEAYVTSFGEEYTLRCRVDVSAEPIEEIELKAHIGVTNVTSNIYSTNYAETEIILDLPHYISEISTFGLRGNGISIESAYFVDETVAAMFDLHVTDDRVLQLIPKVDTSDAAALKLVKSSYKSAIAVVLVGEEEPLVTPEVLNIRVDKKLPTVKATAVKFNTFFTTDTKPLVLSSTGGKVSSIEVVEQPDWLTVDCAMMQVSVSAQNGKYSGKLKLLATVEGYTTAVPVTVSVSAAVVKPKVKLSAASATIFNQAELSEGIFLTVLSNDKKIPYAELGITNISLAELNEKEVKTYAGNSVYEITDFDITTGQFLVSVRKGVAPISGKVLLKVTFNDVDSQFITLPLSIKLYTKAPMLKLSKTSATLNKDLGIGMDSFETKLTVTPADYNYGALDIHVFDKTGKIELTDVLAVQVNGDKIVIRTTTNTEYNATYKVTVGLADAPSVKPVTITIKTLPVNKGLVTLTLTGKGSIDTVRPYATSITLTPKYKNYNNFGVMDERFTVLATNTKAKPQVSVDVTDKFDVIRNANGTYTLKVKDGEHLGPTLKYTVSMSSENMYAKAESKAISLSIKQGSVKVSQSTKSVNLYKSDRFSRRYVTISIADETVLSIDRIELQNADKSLFEVIDFGDGLCAIGFKDSRVAPKIKNGSIKLNVFLEGNETTKPNATVSVSVKVVAFR